MRDPLMAIDAGLLIGLGLHVLLEDRLFLDVTAHFLKAVAVSAFA